PYDLLQRERTLGVRYVGIIRRPDLCDEPVDTQVREKAHSAFPSDTAPHASSAPARPDDARLPRICPGRRCAVAVADYATALTEARPAYRMRATFPTSTIRSWTSSGGRNESQSLAGRRARRPGRVRRPVSAGHPGRRAGGARGARGRRGLSRAHRARLSGRRVPGGARRRRGPAPP